MANPIVEQIAVKIAAALALITTENGYAITVSEVYRPKTIDGYGRESPQNYSIDLVYGDPVRVPEIDTFGTSALIGWDQPFEMFLNLQPGDAGGTPTEQLVEIFSSEVVKKLFENPQWDNLAINSMLGDQTWFINVDDAVVGKSIVLIVRYRVLENNPYSQT